MDQTQHRIMVAVFDTQERAARTIAALLSEGLCDDQLVAVGGENDSPGVADALAGCGIAEEIAAYYEGEVRCGRWLVVARIHLCDAGCVTAAFGRHGGSVRFPPRIRNGS